MSFIGNLFSSLLPGLVPASGGGTTNFLRADGIWTPPPGGGGGGTNINSGYSIVDFGLATNFNNNTIIAITGQSEIISTSIIGAWIIPKNSINQGIDEHWVEDLEIYAGNIIPGVGFTIYAKCSNGWANGQYNVIWEWHN